MSSNALSARVLENLLGQLAQLEEEKKYIVKQCLRSVSSDPRGLEEQLNRYEKKLRELAKSALRTDTDDSSVPFVTIGSEVEVLDEENGEVIVYRVVSPSAFELEGNDVTYLSPIGRALLLKEVGDTATVAAPGGVIRYGIRDIRLRLPQVRMV